MDAKKKVGEDGFERARDRKLREDGRVSEQSSRRGKAEVKGKR